VVYVYVVTPIFDSGVEYNVFVVLALIACALFMEEVVASIVCYGFEIPCDVEVAEGHCYHV